MAARGASRCESAKCKYDDATARATGHWAERVAPHEELGERPRRGHKMAGPTNVAPPGRKRDQTSLGSAEHDTSSTTHRHERAAACKLQLDRVDVESYTDRLTTATACELRLTRPPGTRDDGVAANGFERRGAATADDVTHRRGGGRDATKRMWRRAARRAEKKSGDLRAN